TASINDAVLCEVDMNSSVETYQKRLRDEVSAVEQEIESHNQQVETLNTRLEGLKRALELCDSEQTAVAELLRTGMPGLEFELRKPSRPSGAASPKAAASRKASVGHAPAPARRSTQRGAKAGMA